MHIIYVSREYPPTLRGGGIASYVRDMAHALVKLGHKVTVVCASDDTRLESDETRGNLRIIRLSGGDFVVPAVEKSSLWRKLRSVTRFFSYRKKVRDTILSIKDADIVEVPEFGAESYALENISIPVVIRLHTPAFLDRRNFGLRKLGWKRIHERLCAFQEKELVQSASYITSCSRSLAEWVNRHFEVPQDIIKTIYNPIQIDEWQNNALAKRNPFSVLYVGTVAEEKGVGVLVEACRLLRDRGLEVRLTVAGKLGKYGEELQCTVENRADTWCQFLGNVSRDELKYIYQEHKVACFPSMWDNLPMVCLEAMSSGCIVIGSSSGGMGEIIEDGVDGFLCDPGNPVLLSQKIEITLGLDDVDCNRIQTAARKKLNDKFEMSTVLARMLDYYQYVLNSNKL